MGYLVCDKTVKPKQSDGNQELAISDDIEILTKFTYDESREIGDVKELTIDETKKRY